jgi:pimeloyl-ACP methyl ester carboxylesterase
MSKKIHALWLNTNPSFQRFQRPLFRYLSNQFTLAHWQYCQDHDEPSSLDIALVLLHDYLKTLSYPVHLVGHSTGGLLGLLYARKYPERVKSLTLLAVGVHPTVDWQAHYYILRSMLPCSSEIVLAQMVQNMFGFYSKPYLKDLIKILRRDLNTSPSPHSLYQRVSINPGGVAMPLMVCGSQDDVIADINLVRGWQQYLEPGDLLYECPQGHHFFHYFHSQLVGRKIVKFWRGYSQPVEKEVSLKVSGL